jgi:hypothetical protein
MTAMSYIIGVEKKIACNRLPKSSWGMVSPAGGIHFGNAFGWQTRLDGYMMDFSKKSPFGLPLPV